MSFGLWKRPHLKSSKFCTRTGIFSKVSSALLWKFRTHRRNCGYENRSSVIFSIPVSNGNWLGNQASWVRLHFRCGFLDGRSKCFKREKFGFISSMFKITKLRKLWPSGYHWSSDNPLVWTASLTVGCVNWGHLYEPFAIVEGTKHDFVFTILAFP